MAILHNEGVGHTMTIHSQDESVIKEFALKKPVSRLLVNTNGSLGGVGATTGLAPALTLGCGAMGGSATSDNVGPLNLINIKRVAYGIKELADLRPGQAAKAAPEPAPVHKPAAADTPAEAKGASMLTKEDIERITRSILAKLQ